jgi:hypothetical protein
MLQSFETTFWHKFIIQIDDTYLWHKMIIQSKKQNDVSKWWQKVMTQSVDTKMTQSVYTNWRHKLMTQNDERKGW